MGLGGLLGGGGGGNIDTFEAEMAIMRAQWANNYTRDRANAQIEPYIDYGTGALDELSVLLGIDKPNPMDKLGSDRESAIANLVEQLVWNSGIERSKQSQSVGQMLNFDPYTGKVTGQGGVPTGMRVKQGTRADAERLAAELYDSYAERSRVDPDQEGYGDLMRKFDMERDYEQSPNYLFNLQEGEKALERRAAAEGEWYDPSTTKELTKYSQDLASQEFLNSYGIFQDHRDTRYNMLANLAGMGQSATGQNAATMQAWNQGEAAAQNAKAQVMMAAEMAAAQDSGSSFGGLGKLAGGLIGTAIGGPAGGMIGGSIGQGLGGGGFDLSSLAKGVAGYGAGAGWWGGYDPATGITWNSGRVL